MKKILYLFILFIGAITFSSCSDESEDVDDINKQTVLIFMPWADNLESALSDNLDSIETAMTRQSTTVGRVLVFRSYNTGIDSLYEIICENKQISHRAIKTYDNYSYTTADGITQILNDVQSEAFALNYAMIIGCHGEGWLFKDDWWESAPFAAKRRPYAYLSNGTLNNSKGRRYPLTRFFGSVGDRNRGIDITTLAQGIAGAGIKMQYILFDDCYMANVETAYELKNVTNFLVASTSEVMDIGMPYQTMWTYLNSATPSYSSMVSSFSTFYSNYAWPYGTISAIDCNKLDRLAEQMRMINQNYTLADTLVDSLQVLDGFNTPIFYDLGDYVAKLCTNTDILNDFNATLTQVVRSSSYTDSIYSALYYPSTKFITVNHFSGITISDPSRNSVAVKGREKTAWWRDTH